MFRDLLHNNSRYVEKELVLGSYMDTFLTNNVYVSVQDGNLGSGSCNLEQNSLMVFDNIHKFVLHSFVGGLRQNQLKDNILVIMSDNPDIDVN